jgi:hypothetical protein
MVCKETALEEIGERELTTVAGEDIRAGCSDEARIRARPGQNNQTLIDPPKRTIH